ncbi:MAG: TonB-dependent siderophore receptor [Sphingomonas sp.]
MSLPQSTAPTVFTRRTAVRLPLLAGAMLAAAPALAQTADPAGDAAQANTAAAPQTTRTTVDGQQEIIVTAKNFVPEGSTTATKTNIPLIETPQSISVITRDQIDLLNFTDAQQAVRYTAGAFGENYGPDLRFDFFTVRGFTPTQYIDGLAAPVSTTISSVGVDLYAFQSLNILKGPASVLYGSAPPGGIFNEVSRRADSTFGGEIRAKYGSNDFKELAGTIAGAASDNLDVRITGLYRDRGAEVNDVHAKRLLIAPTATLKIGSSTTFTPLAYYQYDRVQGGEGGFLPVQGTLLANPNGRISRSTNLGDPKDVYLRRQYGAGYDFQHDFSQRVSFQSNLKWSHYNEDTPYGVYDAGGFLNTTDPTQPDYYRTIGQSNFTYRESVASFATDNRLDATVDTGPVRHKLLVGVDYRNVHNVADYGFAGSNALDVYDPVYSSVAADLTYPTRYNHQRLQQTGVYAQDQLKLGRFYVLANGRYDWVTSHYLTPYTAVSAPATTNEQKSHKFTYRLGANYVTASGLTPYISYATSFVPQIGADGSTGQSFKPSAGKQWEGGIKYDGRALPPGIKLFASAALFNIKQTNVVSTTPSVSPVYGTQSGEVEVYGGEVEFVARIHDQLSINGSYSYNHSEVLKSNTAAEIGNPLSVTPKNKASLFVDYTLQKGGLGGLGFGVGARYTSSSAGSLPGPYNPVVYYGQAATLFDAMVHYDLPGWRFAINGSNILDKTYVARCSGPAGCVYGAGREIIGTVTKKF